MRGAIDRSPRRRGFKICIGEADSCISDLPDCASRLTPHSGRRHDIRTVAGMPKTTAAVELGSSETLPHDRALLLVHRGHEGAPSALPLWVRPQLDRDLVVCAEQVLRGHVPTSRLPAARHGIKIQLQHHTFRLDPQSLRGFNVIASGSSKTYSRRFRLCWWSHGCMHRRPRHARRRTMSQRSRVER